MGKNHKTTRASHDALQQYREECASSVRSDGKVGLACWLCEQDIDYDAPFDDWLNDDRFQRDHFYPVSTHPELAEDDDNWRPSHAGCNRDRGNLPPRPPLGEPSQAWT